MIRRLVQDERGIALVMALAIMTVLSLTTAALMIVVAANHRESLTSLQARKAFGLAEAGLADAQGMVYGAAAAHTTPPTGTQGPLTVDGGTVWYWASVAGDGHTWTMFGKGQYPAGSGTTRTISTQANVPGPVTVQDTGVWNYLYADSTSSGCATSVQGSTTVDVPMYVRGNLCLNDPFTGSQLGVGGDLTIGSKGKIGTSTSPVGLLAVAGSCNGVAAGTGACDGATDPIYASHVSSNLGIAAGLPVLNMPNLYSTANPGPGTGHGCQTGSGVPTPFFDNDSTLNNSLASVNLFPNSNYDCVNGANEIKWCATVNAAQNCSTANTLYVNGTFLFDGNLNLNGNAQIVYSGLGTMYFTGVISTSGNTTLCGISGCGANWDTDTAALVLAAACWADSTGTTLVNSPSFCVDYGGTNSMQVATYCATSYFIKGTATNWGPVLANTLSLNGNLSELVPFKIMPPGTPTNTRTSYLPASAPTYWSG
jgi:hypothetical protein